MKYSIWVMAPITFFLVFPGLLWAQQETSKEFTSDTNFKQKILPILQGHCVDCHGDEDAEGGVEFSTVLEADHVLDYRDEFERALKQLAVSGMPPEDSGYELTEEASQTLMAWLDWKLYRVDCDIIDDAGWVSIHRLNRAEYNNTIRDLFEIDIQPANDFPVDNVGHGFSNMGEALKLPLMLLEKYFNASEDVAQAVIISQPEDGEKKQFSGASFMTTGSVNDGQAGFKRMFSTGSVFCQHEVDVAGEYLIRIEAAAEQAGPELAKMELRIDDQKIEVVEIKGHLEPRFYEFKQSLKAGVRKIEAAFVNDYYQPKTEDAQNRDRNLGVRMIEVNGPTEIELPESHRRIVIAKPEKNKPVKLAAQEVFAHLMPRVFRRPVDDVEVDRIVKLVELATQRGETFERGVQIGVQALLVSPHFLFRIEYHVEPDGPPKQHSINDFELASRLSYFLWSSMPDDELFELATQKRLHQPDELDHQINRMLADPKAQALIQNFAFQWLSIGNLAEVKPSPDLFPEFTPELRADMIRETELFVSHILRENQSILDLIDGHYTFLNQRLANHYGMQKEYDSTKSKSDPWQKISLENSQRRGVLTHGSVLTLTSNPDRTSLVRRGKWLIDNVLGLDFPDPPAVVTSLEEGAKQSGAATLREQLKIHREDPTCASCHNTMDPLGFGFENFDAIGRWRDVAEGIPVDSSGILPGAGPFQGPIELVGILKKRKEKFSDLVARKMLTYALGRGLHPPDLCVVDDIVADLKKNEFRSNVLIKGIVHSSPFLKRREDEDAAQGDNEK